MTASHGTRSCYQSGCRLPECRLANCLYVRKTRELKAAPWGQKYAPRHNLQTVWELWDCTPTLSEWQAARA